MRLWLLPSALLVLLAVTAPNPGAFREVPASERGVSWTHDNAMSKERFLPETMLPDVAMLDYDEVVALKAGPPLLLYNSGESKNNWIGFHLMGATANPTATGAIIKWSVEVVVHSRPKTAGGSFMSSHHPREVLGLGSSDKVNWVQIHWSKSSMRVDRFTDPSVSRYYTLVEGKETRNR